MILLGLIGVELFRWKCPEQEVDNVVSIAAQRLRNDRSVLRRLRYGYRKEKLVDRTHCMAR